MTLAAAGLRSTLAENSAIRLSLLADAGTATLQIEGEESLAEMESAAHRARVGLELSGAGAWSPFVRLNGRYDGGGRISEVRLRSRGRLRSRSRAAHLGRARGLRVARAMDGAGERRRRRGGGRQQLRLRGIGRHGDLADQVRARRHRVIRVADAGLGPARRHGPGLGAGPDAGHAAAGGRRHGHDAEHGNRLRDRVLAAAGVDHAHARLRARRARRRPAPARRRLRGQTGVVAGEASRSDSACSANRLWKTPPGAANCACGCGGEPELLCILVPPCTFAGNSRIYNDIDDLLPARTVRIEGYFHRNVGTRMGYSVEHWEGETLVAETTHLNRNRIFTAVRLAE